MDNFPKELQELICNFLTQEELYVVRCSIYIRHNFLISYGIERSGFLNLSKERFTSNRLKCDNASFPKTLKTLKITTNKLRELPKVYPAYLKFLSVSLIINPPNKLKALQIQNYVENLPETLQYLKINGALHSPLKKIPKSLKYLVLNDNYFDSIQRSYYHLEENFPKLFPILHANFILHNQKIIYEIKCVRYEDHFHIISVEANVYELSRIFRMPDTVKYIKATDGRGYPLYNKMLKADKMYYIFSTYPSLIPLEYIPKDLLYLKFIKFIPNSLNALPPNLTEVILNNFNNLSLVKESSITKIICISGSIEPKYFPPTLKYIWKFHQIGYVKIPNFYIYSITNYEGYNFVKYCHESIIKKTLYFEDFVPEKIPDFVKYLVKINP